MLRCWTSWDANVTGEVTGEVVYAGAEALLQHQAGDLVNASLDSPIESMFTCCHLGPALPGWQSPCLPPTCTDRLGPQGGEASFPSASTLWIVNTDVTQILLQHGVQVWDIWDESVNQKLLAECCTIAASYRFLLLPFASSATSSQRGPDPEGSEALAFVPFRTMNAQLRHRSPRLGCLLA